MMKAFFLQHQIVIGAIGAGTSLASGVMGFLNAVNPILQCIALVVSISAGCFTIAHFFRSRAD